MKFILIRSSLYEFKTFVLTILYRHRAVNLFLQGYDKSWIETEEHYFEDKLIEDLAVCLGAKGCGNVLWINIHLV